MKLLFAAMLVSSSTCAALGKRSTIDARIDGALDGWVAKAKSLCGESVGDIGVGVMAGGVCGFASKKVQNTLVMGAMVGGGAIAAGCYSTWDTSRSTTCCRRRSSTAKRPKSSSAAGGPSSLPALTHTHTQRGRLLQMGQSNSPASVGVFAQVRVGLRREQDDNNGDCAE